MVTFHGIMSRPGSIIWSCAVIKDVMYKHNVVTSSIFNQSRSICLSRESA